MNKQNKRFAKRIIYSTTALFIISIFFLNLKLINHLENVATDYKYKYFNRTKSISNDIILVDIDNNSINELETSLGQYPWPRSIYKDLIEFIQLGQPKGILFDILFSEKQKDGTEDDIFAEVLGLYKNISHAVELSSESAFVEGKFNPFPPELINRFTLNISNKDQISLSLLKTFNNGFLDYTGPIESILANTQHLHFVSAYKDPDGIFRSTPMIYKYGDLWLPSLSLKGLLLRLNDPTVSIKNDTIEVSDSNHKYKIPMDSRGFTNIHYYANYTNLENHVSIAYLIAQARKLLKGEISDPSELELNPLDYFKDKIVFFGASATGLADLKSTPVSSSLPGVHIHSTVLSNILENDYRKDSSIIFNLFLILVFIVAIYLAIYFLTTILFKTLVPIFLIFLYIALNTLFFKYFNFQIPLLFPTILFFIAIIEGFIFTTIIEGKRTKKITGTFSKYLSEDLTKYLIENEINPSAEVGKLENLTILFSDIRGFTSFSEKMPPKSLVQFLNKYLNQMSSVIINHKGTLDKYIGDAIMAFWGAPVENKNHAIDAVLAALQMVRELEDFNLNAKKNNELQIEIGIGLNSGPVIVGNIGSDKKLDYTVIGDNVNLASRIEGLTKQYGVPILIGENTYQQIKTHFKCRPIDCVRAKGKDEAVMLYQPIYSVGATLESSESINAICNITQSAFDLYKQGHFEEAKQLYQECFNINANDSVAELFILRCEELIKNKPTKWTGVFTAETK